MSAQLPLALHWPRRACFDDYRAGPNAAAVELLRAFALRRDGPWIHLCGPTDSGKTHLLLAVCAHAGDDGRAVRYLSLRSVAHDRAAAIRALADAEAYALDDLDTAAGDRDAEHALFDLYNRLRADGAAALFAARQPPAATGYDLPDLVSRLSACTQLALKPLEDGDRRALVCAHATARGIDLEPAALDWLFAHRRRDTGSLLAALERIDRGSLAAQRRITLPFLRQLFGSGNLE